MPTFWLQNNVGIIKSGEGRMESLGIRYTRGRRVNPLKGITRAEIGSVKADFYPVRGSVEFSKQVAVLLFAGENVALKLNR